jgi:hypothetical protein
MAAVHKPARGRQRAKQLNEMTEEEREVERELIMEKNRLAARDCRVRKKSFIHTLQDKIKSQDVLHEEQEAQILALQAENAQIKAELQRVLASMNTTTPRTTTLPDIEISTPRRWGIAAVDDDETIAQQPLAKKIRTV